MHRKLHSIHELINKQCFLWREQALARGDASEVPHEDGLAVETFGPYVTLSRDYGCKALEIASLLAARLGWTVYDKEIVDEIARDARVTKSVVESLDERSQSWLEEYIANLTFMKIFTEEAFYRHLVKVVTVIGRHGKAVIVGRGANYILPPSKGVRVRLTAPLPYRVRRLSPLSSETDKATRKRIQDMDHDRAGFVRRLYGRAIDNPSAYNLTIDVSDATHSEVVDRIVASLRSKELVEPISTLDSSKGVRERGSRPAPAP